MTHTDDMKITSDALHTQLDALRQSRSSFYEQDLDGQNQGLANAESLAEPNLSEIDASTVAAEPHDPAIDLLLADVWASDSAHSLNTVSEPPPNQEHSTLADWTDRLVSYVLA